MKAKIRAVRFFLAQTNPDLCIVRKKFYNMRSFRTNKANEILNNPFLSEHKHLYVLERIAQWADVVFKSTKWWLYANDEAVYELKKCIAGEPFKQLGEADYEPIYYDICLHNAKVAFFNGNAEDEPVN